MHRTGVGHHSAPTRSFSFRDCRSTPPSRPPNTHRAARIAPRVSFDSSAACGHYTQSPNAGGRIPSRAALDSSAASGHYTQSPDGDA